MLSLYVREKVEGRWRYRRIPTGKGKKTSHIKGPFYCRPFFQGKQLWRTLLAATFEEAQEEANQLTVALEAQAKGLTIAQFENTRNVGRVSLKSAVEKFLSQAQSTKKNKTVLGYRLNLNQFVESTKIKFLDELSKDTLCEFRDFLLQKGYGARTQHNRIITVLSLLNDNKIETDFSLRKDLPTFQEEIAAAYTVEELKKLFDVMDAEEKIRYKFFLGTGCRDQEVTYASWGDIDFEKKTYHVRAKTDVGFTPKNHEDRLVPMPTSLTEALRSRKKSPAHSRWIFVNEDGRPDNHFLRKLKRIAFRAGLNCGECITTITKGRYDTKYRVEVSCKTDPVCQKFYLHRFRKTCATHWHEAGIPIRTIQRWLGHKSLETTQLYLGETDAAKLRVEIDKAFGD